MATKTRKFSLWTFADRFEGDKVVWIILLMLCLISIVCMFSSTSRLLKPDTTRLDLVKEQAILVAAGLGIIILLYNIRNIKVFRWCSMVFGFSVPFLLLLMLDLRVDTPVVKALYINGAYRILSVGGMQVHVFEVVKVAMVLYLAWALDAFKKGELKGSRLSPIWKKIIYIYAPFLIIFVMIIPGGNSSALFIGGIMFLVILLGGGNFKDLLVLFLAGLAIIGVCIGIYHASDGKYMERIGTAISRVTETHDWEAQFLKSRPGSREYQDAIDKLRQPYSAKIAIHEGGLFGKGPGQSTQRYVVPDISEDYMYSFIIEEYGLFGGILVICLYVSLLARGSIIVRNCGKDLYAKLSVAGLCLLISGQAFLHMFVNADIGPMTGQTLPMISHGASAFLCFCVAFGVILSFSRIAARRIEKETREAEPLMEPRDELSATLDDLDAFESGKLENDDEIQETQGNY